MENCIRKAPRVTIGLDIGDRHSYFFAVDEAGEFLEEGRLRTKAEDLRQRFSAYPPGRVAIETGTHSPWVSQLLAECRHQVLVANSRRLALISQNQKKSDRMDAEILAELAYSKPKLLAPIRHRGPEAQAVLSVIRARDALVAARTQLVNHVRGAVKSSGARLPSCSTRCFHEKVKDSIPSQLHPALAALLETIKAISEQIGRYDDHVEEQCEKAYPETQLLQQVGGVGPLTALAFILILEDPKRFARSRNVGAFLGLVPRRQESGEQQPQLRITKAGDVLLRRLLVGSAHYIVGPFGPDTDLRRHGEAIARRGGKNAKKRAVVAVARKLSVLLHRLWTTGEVYEPLRNATRRKESSTPAGTTEPVQTMAQS